MTKDAMSERKKAQLCTEWLEYCKSIGWPDSALPDMADIFWKYEGWKTFKGYKP